MRRLRAVFMMVAVVIVATCISLLAPRPALASDFTVAGVVSCTNQLTPWLVTWTLTSNVGNSLTIGAARSGQGSTSSNNWNFDSNGTAVFTTRPYLDQQYDGVDVTFEMYRMVDPANKFYASGSVTLGHACEWTATVTPVLTCDGTKTTFALDIRADPGNGFTRPFRVEQVAYSPEFSLAPGQLKRVQIVAPGPVKVYAGSRVIWNGGTMGCVFPVTDPPVNPPVVPITIPGNGSKPGNGSGSGGQPVSDGRTAIISSDGPSTGTSSGPGGTELSAAPTPSVNVSTVEGSTPGTVAAPVAHQSGILWWSTGSGLVVLVAVALGATYAVRRRRSASLATAEVAPLNQGDEEEPLEQAR